MSRVSITGPEAIVDYAERQVCEGRFRSVDAFFEEAVRNDRDERPLTTAELRERLDQALAGGTSPRQLPAIMDEVKARLMADGRL